MTLTFLFWGEFDKAQKSNISVSISKYWFFLSTLTAKKHRVVQFAYIPFTRFFISFIFPLRFIFHEIENWKLNLRCMFTRLWIRRALFHWNNYFHLSNAIQLVWFLWESFFLHLVVRNWDWKIRVEVSKQESSVSFL